MKANEFRIGNFVNAVGEISTVYMIFKGVFYALSEEGISFKDTWAEIDPIPITEEWLVKFGFKQDSILMAYMYNGFAFRNDDFTNVTFDLNASWHSCQYVHQLQNLYFALKGEELIPKNKLL